MIQLIQRPKLEEVTEEEYKLHNDETDPLAYSDYIKEPYYKEGCGILWQIEHYNDPPAGYRYYKKVGTECLILCGSTDVEWVQKMMDKFDSNLQNDEQRK